MLTIMRRFPERRKTDFVLTPPWGVSGRSRTGVLKHTLRSGPSRGGRVSSFWLSRWGVDGGWHGGAGGCAGGWVAGGGAWGCEGGGGDAAALVVILIGDQVQGDGEDEEDSEDDGGGPG